MYNIHSHYENVLALAKTKGYIVSLGYFFPFGSTSEDNLEFINGKLLTDENNRNTDTYLISANTSEANLNHKQPIFIFCYDQEPLVHDFVKDKFKAVQEHACFDSIVGITTPDYFFFDHYGSYVYVRDLYKAYQFHYEKTPISVILLNTEKNSKEKQSILNEFNFIDCYYFFHAFAAVDWYRGYYYCADILPIPQRNVKKKYICFNRITGSSRSYRSFLIAKLKQKNLLDLGHVSYSKTCPVHGNLLENLVEVAKNYNISNDEVTKCFEILKDVQEDLRIDTPKNSVIENDSFTIGPIKESIESFVHVVTETCFWEEKLHLTEKIFKPIVLKQPFILVGCAKNLEYLKSYGFKTFDKWWDESYDDCDDPLTRLDKIVEIIETISNRSNEELEKILQEMEEVLEHNYNRFYSQEFIKYAWDELVTNLDQAIAQLPPQTS